MCDYTADGLKWGYAPATTYLKARPDEPNDGGADKGGGPCDRPIRIRIRAFRSHKERGPSERKDAGGPIHDTSRPCDHFFAFSPNSAYLRLAEKSVEQLIWQLSECLRSDASHSVKPIKTSRSLQV
jgi:hypothetical protein